MSSDDPAKFTDRSPLDHFRGSCVSIASEASVDCGILDGFPLPDNIRAPIPAFTENAPHNARSRADISEIEPVPASCVIPCSPPAPTGPTADGEKSPGQYQSLALERRYQRYGHKYTASSSSNAQDIVIGPTHADESFNDSSVSSNPTSAVGSVVTDSDLTLPAAHPVIVDGKPRPQNLRVMQLHDDDGFHRASARADATSESAQLPTSELYSALHRSSLPDKPRRAFQSAPNSAATSFFPNAFVPSTRTLDESPVTFDTFTFPSHRDADTDGGSARPDRDQGSARAQQLKTLHRNELQQYERLRTFPRQERKYSDGSIEVSSGRSSARELADGGRSPDSFVADSTSSVRLPATKNFQDPRIENLRIGPSDDEISSLDPEEISEFPRSHRKSPSALAQCYSSGWTIPNGINQPSGDHRSSDEQSSDRPQRSDESNEEYGRKYGSKHLAHESVKLTHMDQKHGLSIEDAVDLKPNTAATNVHGSNLPNNGHGRLKPDSSPKVVPGSGNNNSGNANFVNNIDESSSANNNNNNNNNNNEDNLPRPSLSRTHSFSRSWDAGDKYSFTVPRSRLAPLVPLAPLNVLMSPEEHVRQGAYSWRSGDPFTAHRHWLLAASHPHNNATAMLLLVIGYTERWFPPTVIVFPNFGINFNPSIIQNTFSLVTKRLPTPAELESLTRPMFPQVAAGISEYATKLMARQLDLEALEFLELAGKLGSAEAFTTAAKIYYKGSRRVPKDIHKAKRLYERANQLP